jgi:hypothetical protein
LIKARFEYARDRVATKADHKKAASFKRNWKLYKPHQKNTIHDFRARTHRACWQFRNNYLKLNDCFEKYIKEYEDELYKLLVQKPEDEDAPSVLVQLQNRRKIHANPVVAAKANNRELSTASSVSSDASTSSSAETSEDNHGRHHAKLKR